MIMVLSIAGFLVTRNNTSANKREYNGYTFTFIPSKNFWETDWNDINLDFIYEPDAAAQVKIQGDPVARLKNTKMFLMSYDNDSDFISDMALVQYDFQRLLQPNLDIFVDGGMAFPNTYGQKVITCENATSTTPVLLFRGGNETLLKEQGDCIIATARDQADVYLLADRILYGLYGII